MNNPPIVITSGSCVTPIGKGLNSTWNAILNQTNGISEISRFPANTFPCNFAGEIKHDLTDLLPSQGRSMINYQNKLLLWAVLDSFKHLDNSNLSEATRKNIPVYIGSGIISNDARAFQTLLKIFSNLQEDNLNKFASQINKIPPLEHIKVLPTVSCHFIAKNLNIHGDGNPIYTGFTSSLNALLQAVNAIQIGKTEIAIVASSEAPLSPQTYHYLSKLNIGFDKSNSSLSEEEASRPLDLQRNGVVFCEAAACCIVESLKSAKKRKATPLAIIENGTINLYPNLNDFTLTKNNFINLFENLFSEATLTPKDIDCIFPFAPSHPLWDKEEIDAINIFFAKQPYKLLSIKGHMGFAGSCSGLLDCLVALNVLETNHGFKIKNFEQPNKGYEFLFDHIYTKPEHQFINSCLINCADVGGFYSSVILKRWN